MEGRSLNLKFDMKKNIRGKKKKRERINSHGLRPHNEFIYRPFTYRIYRPFTKYMLYNSTCSHLIKETKLQINQTCTSILDKNIINLICMNVTLHLTDKLE